MIMKNTTIILLVIFLAVGLNSCKKTYEEGPAISLRSKFSRITGKWKLVSIEGVPRLHPEVDQYMELTKEKIDGEKYKAVFTNFQEQWGNTKDTLFTCEGYWKFNDGPYGGCAFVEDLDKKEGLTLILQTDSGSTGVTWKIKRLTNKELIITHIPCIDLEYYRNVRTLTFEKE